jgi:PAS domain S-box-containing protein
MLTRLRQVSLGFKFLQAMPKVNVLEVLCDVVIGSHVRHQSRSQDGKGKEQLISDSSRVLVAMAEATRPSKRFNNDTNMDLTSKGHQEIRLQSEGENQPVSYVLPSGQVRPADPGMIARPGFGLTNSQHAQVTQAALDQGLLGVAFVGLDSRIQHANQALADLLCYSQEELSGMALESLIRRPGHAQGFLHNTETSQGQQRRPPAVNYLTRKSGDTVACLVDSRAIHDENGKVTHFLVFARSASSGRGAEELHRLENELYGSQALQTLGMLAGGVAHDFNNALEVIIGFASLARIRLSKADPLHEPLKIIEESAKGAAGLARRLLDVSRDNPDDEGPVDAGELIGVALSIVTRTFDRKIRIEHRIAPQLPWMKGNRSRLQQAILNLCLNARDAMQEGGTLVIEADLQTLKPGDVRLPEASAPGHYVRIAVRDTGEGIPADIVEKIFVPLFTTKGPGRGTGLGLPMVDRIVKEAQGFISVTSKPGEGSEFSLYLPAVISERPRPTTSRPGQMLAGRGRVLVIDDEPRVLQFLEKGLTRLGYEVVTAQSGSEACEIYSRKSETIKCVLLDLIMPGMSGLETYARLKDINPGVKVILSSGYSSGRIKREAEEAGSPEFLEKPFTLEELSQALRKIQQN